MNNKELKEKTEYRELMIGYDQEKAKKEFIKEMHRHKAQRLQTSLTKEQKATLEAIAKRIKEKEKEMEEIKKKEEEEDKKEEGEKEKARRS